MAPDDEYPTQREPMQRQHTERVGDVAGPSADNDAALGRLSRSRMSGDPIRSKILYGGAVGLVATILVAVGLAALFDISIWAALGITALIGLGLAMLLAVLVG